MPILLFTSNNTASLKIAEKLMENHGFAESGENEWEKNGIRLMDTKAPTILDIPTDFETDYILVLSSHKSRAGEKMLTAHFPGNWGDAKFGGNPKTLNTADGGRIKMLLQELAKANDTGWPVYMEADHHGPTCSVPMIFVEIGSTEEEWKNENAAAAAASAVDKCLSRNERYESVLGIGGGHYAREFTKMVVEGDYAVGHIAPKYALDALDFGMFRQAIEKNVETVRKVFLLRESTNRKHKREISGFCAELGLECIEI